MALSSLRLRRTLTLTTSIFKTCTSPSLSPKPQTYTSIAHLHPINPNNPMKHYLKTQTFGFRSSLPSPSSRSSSYSRDDDEKISEETILFEGCDYNHWLITMDFPKDPRPTPEQMVETYVQTLAKVVGSVEEAKKRMYACSTTTYNGFQAIMDEETSEKFRGLPGVVFILPDSYIDPINKEYGGDKYVNGTIIPRHPPVPVVYTRPRYDDRNRRPRDSGPMQNDRPGPPYGDVRNYGLRQNFAQGPPQGDGRNYGPPQNFAQGPPRGDGRNYGPPPPQNFAQGPPAQTDGRNYEAQQNYQPQQSFAPNPAGQDGRGSGGQPNYATQQNYGPRPTGQFERRDGYPTDNNNYAYGGKDSYQGEQRDAIPPNQGDFAQAGRRDYGTPENRGDFRGDNRNFSPSPAGDYRQETGSSMSQGYPGSNQGQGFQKMDQGQQNFTPMGQMQNDQGGY